MTDELFDIRVLFGSVRIESRITPEGVGEGRRVEMDGDGNVTLVTPWTPTGAVIHWGTP